MHLQVAPDQAAPGSGNDLMLGADAPLWAAAQVPLVNEMYMPLPPPRVGLAGHALSLSDQQVSCVRHWSMHAGVWLLSHATGWCEPVAWYAHVSPGNQARTMRDPCLDDLCTAYFSQAISLSLAEAEGHATYNRPPMIAGADLHQLQQLPSRRADRGVLDAECGRLPLRHALLLLRGGVRQVGQRAAHLLLLRLVGWHWAPMRCDSRAIN